MDVSVEVCELAVAVWVVEVLESGALDCGGMLDGELAPGVVDCGELGELGVLCATAQTADSSNVAVIK